MLKILSYLVALSLQLVVASAWAGELNFSTTTASVAENAKTLTITVTRTGDASGAASVSIASTDGTAKASTDFTAVSSTLNWTAGNSDSKTVDITITDNAVVGDDKLFTLSLSSVTGDTIGAQGNMTVTITDYEEGILQFNGAIFQAAEDSKIARIKIARTSGTNGVVGATISFTDVTAVKGSDYFGADKTVSFADGVSEFILDIILKNDAIGEASESFTATISSPTGGAIVGAQDSANIEIIDTDADFTTTATKITITNSNVVQPDVIDLNQPSLLDGSQTYLALINEIPLMALSKLSIVQGSGGLAEIQFGGDKFFLRPVRISRNSQNLNIGVRQVGTSLYRFVTANNLVIDMHPAVASIDSLQSALAALSMPELIITDYGNITIQKDQGAPKIEENDSGELVLSDSFYERWHVRAMPMITNSPYNVTGIYQQGHPSAAGHSIVSLYFLDGSNYRVQYFHSAPADDQELEVRMRQSIGVTDVEFLDYGLINIKRLTNTQGGWTTTEQTLIPDYTLFKRQSESIENNRFREVGDLNGDGLPDFEMIYQSNDRQFFFSARLN